MGPSAHMDDFARRNLPPRELWPDLINLERFDIPARVNVAVELVERQIEAGFGERPALLSDKIRWSYNQLGKIVNQLANLMVSELDFVPGNRVLIRSANTPMMVALYLAVLKAGGVVVATMPLLRAKELSYIIEKGDVKIAFCDERLGEELHLVAGPDSALKNICMYSHDLSGPFGDRLALQSEEFAACDTAADDVCLFGFTSGTTGEPKATMHFHRDLLLVADIVAPAILQVTPQDVFVGSPPLAFTFGLGGLVLFPLRYGAASILLEKAGPDAVIAAIERFGATICFTAPTAYRAMLDKLEQFNARSLRKCISSGESLPDTTWQRWLEATGIRLTEGIGSTEMLHMFIASNEDKARPGSVGQPLPGYEARIIDENGAEVPRAERGRLAVRGPTGCRYLADQRQLNYVQNGWNVTGDIFYQDEEGYFYYVARSDDMIISAGYNISGIEVENALLAHEAVRECGVIGTSDEARGQIVHAFIVLQDDFSCDEAMTKLLQDHVKAVIAPYKYPRAITYRTELPRTENGKLQRFHLRQDV